MECSFIRKFTKKNMLKPVFALLEADYNMHSSPDRISGWLKTFIAESPCFPVWDASLVRKSAQGIASQLEAIVLRNKKHLNKLNAISSFSSTSPLRQHSFGSSDKLASAERQESFGRTLPGSKSDSFSREDSLLGAWEILNSAANVRDQEALDNIMEEIGVNGPDDLRQFEKTDLVHMTKTLKKVQQKKFLEVLLEK